MSVKLEGFSELDKKLAALPRATAGNVLLRTLKVAAKPIADDAKANAPDDPRTGFPDIKTSVAIKKTKNNRNATKYYKQVEVGVYFPLIRNAKTGIPTGRWIASRLLEYGSGDMPHKPFMRPAFDANAQQALSIIKTELASQIEKAAARIAKKQGR